MPRELGRYHARTYRTLVRMPVGGWALIDDLGHTVWLLSPVTADYLAGWRSVGGEVVDYSP